MTHYLITGGAGFIGSHVTEAALAGGMRSPFWTNLSSGRRENLPEPGPNLDVVVGDIRDMSAVRMAAKGAHMVIHLAAITEVPLTVENPELSAEVNDIGFLRVLQAAREIQARRVVYASSSAVYGAARPPHRETMTPLPDSPYAAHKLLGEHYAHIYSSLYGLSVVSLRFFNVYGPRQRPDSAYSGVVSRFIERLTAGETPVVHGMAASTGFRLVRDVAEAILQAASVPAVGGRVYNVGTGKAVSIIDLLRELAGICERPAVAGHAPARLGDVYASLADVGRSREELGFTAATPLKEGLRHTVQWFRGVEGRDS